MEKAGGMEYAVSKAFELINKTIEKNNLLPKQDGVYAVFDGFNNDNLAVYHVSNEVVAYDIYKDFGGGRGNGEFFSNAQQSLNKFDFSNKNKKQPFEKMAGSFFERLNDGYLTGLVDVRTYPVKYRDNMLEHLKKSHEHAGGEQFDTITSDFGVSGNAIIAVAGSNANKDLKRVWSACYDLGGEKFVHEYGKVAGLCLNTPTNIISLMISHVRWDDGKSSVVGNVYVKNNEKEVHFNFTTSTKLKKIINNLVFFVPTVSALSEDTYSLKSHSQMDELSIMLLKYAADLFTILTIQLTRQSVGDGIFTSFAHDTSYPTVMTSGTPFLIYSSDGKSSSEYLPKTDFIFIIQHANLSAAIGKSDVFSANNSNSNNSGFLSDSAKHNQYNNDRGAIFSVRNHKNDKMSNDDKKQVILRYDLKRKLDKINKDIVELNEVKDDIAHVQNNKNPRETRGAKNKRNDTFVRANSAANISYKKSPDPKLFMANIGRATKVIRKKLTSRKKNKINILKRLEKMEQNGTKKRENKTDDSSKDVSVDEDEKIYNTKNLNKEKINWILDRSHPKERGYTNKELQNFADNYSSETKEVLNYSPNTDLLVLPSNKKKRRIGGKSTRKKHKNRKHRKTYRN